MYTADHTEYARKTRHPNRSSRPRDRQARAILVPITRARPGATDEGTALMSQEGPPPSEPDGGQRPEQQPGAPAGPPPPEVPGYNPYPSNWENAPSGNPAYNV